MSHYTVGVILKKDVINKKVEEVVNMFETETNEIVTNEERKVIEYDAIKYFTEEALLPYSENLPVKSYVDVTMEELKEEHKKHKNLSLEEYVNEFYGCELTEKGLISTYNPNSKWDWYVIGGRWAGSLIIKNRPKNIKEISPYEDDSNSYAQIKDICFKKIITEKQRQEYEDNYNKLIETGDFYRPEYYLKKYPNFENYLKDKITFSTYALLDSKGEWHEPGQMGWFGCSSATPEEERNFNDVFLSLIQQEDEENYFVLVDCHI